MRGPSGSKGQLERFQPIGRSGQRSEDHLKSGQVCNALKRIKDNKLLFTFIVLKNFRRSKILFACSLIVCIFLLTLTR